MRLFLIILLCFVASPVVAQNIIQGRVVEDATEQPIPYIDVYFPQLEKGAISDEDGNFIIKNLPKGTYKLVYSSLGYETSSINITLPYKEQLTITLKTSAVEMDEIIISTPFHKLQRDNVMMVERAKISDLKANGAVTLAQGISEIPGVESITTGMSIGKPVIRGLSSNRVLVYTQGVRLENQQFGDEHGLGINDAGIESVEVIKGPASLLYGSDALGGVLYLNPERFANQDETHGDFAVTYYGNTQGIGSNIGFKTSGDGFKFLVRGSISEHSDYDTKDYRVTNTRFKEKDFKAGFGYQNTNFKTEFRYNLNDSKLGIPEEIGVQSTNKTPLLPYQQITNHILSSKSNIFFDNSSLDVTFGYIYNDRKEFEEAHDHDDHDHDDDHDDHDDDDHDEDEDLDPALQMKLKTFNYDVKYNLPSYGKFETIVGVQGMNQVNTNYGEETLIPDATTIDIGLLATSHIHFEKIDVQIGARYDNRKINTETDLNKDFNSFNGAAGLKTDIAKNTSLRLNLASGFRAPNLAELTSYGSHEGTNRFEIGDPNLKNEQNFQADLAIEYKNKHIEVFANGFYNNINNYIYLTPDGEIINDVPVYLYVQDDAALYGGEFGFHIHPHPIHWLHIESSFETVTGKQDNGDYLPLIPANNFKNTIRVEFDKSWIKKGYAFVKLSSTLAQNNVSEFEIYTDGYNLFSAGIGGDFKVFKNTLNVSLTGNNLTNKKYISHLSRLKYDGIYNMGRDVSVGFTYKI
ncbi:TonB-dependent receptor [Formosa sp. PL04]|uniref:TonB-dependent receptor n=1 Tax=Formosa sp. PL04 TaxID=3081755 RepID=UPI002981012D|nr:TonB-dependent receptor [Formosa sp. PL04]MDW5288353.1 TonB-dependent receptor [Formosa sp. PL04]